MSKVSLTSLDCSLVPTPQALFRLPINVQSTYWFVCLGRVVRVNHDSHSGEQLLAGAWTKRYPLLAAGEPLQVRHMDDLHASLFCVSFLSLNPFQYIDTSEQSTELFRHRLGKNTDKIRCMIPLSNTPQGTLVQKRARACLHQITPGICLDYFSHQPALLF